MLHQASVCSQPTSHLCWMVQVHTDLALTDFYHTQTQSQAHIVWLKGTPTTQSFAKALSTVLWSLVFADRCPHLGPELRASLWYCWTTYRAGITSGLTSAAFWVCDRPQNSTYYWMKHKIQGRDMHTAEKSQTLTLLLEEWTEGQRWSCHPLSQTLAFNCL